MTVGRSRVGHGSLDSRGGDSGARGASHMLPGYHFGKRFRSNEAPFFDITSTREPAGHVSGYHMAVVAGVVFFVLRALFALMPAFSNRHPIKN
jgi:hypothetical protein